VPSIVDRTVFVGASDGHVYALDSLSGCLYWSYAASAGVRVAPVIWNGAVYFGDLHGYMYGVKATTGLREGGRGLSSQSRERHRARKTLVVVQVALALVLLICSGLMIRTFRALTRVSPGFSDPNTIASFDIFIPTSQVPDTSRIDVLRMQQAIANRLAAVPGVSSVAISSSLPMIQDRSFDPVYASDHTYKEGELPTLSLEKFVSPGFFQTMGIPLIVGRDVTWQEELEKRPVVYCSKIPAFNILSTVHSQFPQDELRQLLLESEISSV